MARTSPAIAGRASCLGASGYAYRTRQRGAAPALDHERFLQPRCVRVWQPVQRRRACSRLAAALAAGRGRPPQSRWRALRSGASWSALRCSHSAGSIRTFWNALSTVRAQTRVAGLKVVSVEPGRHFIAHGAPKRSLGSQRRDQVIRFDSRTRTTVCDRQPKQIPDLWPPLPLPLVVSCSEVRNYEHSEIQLCRTFARGTDTHRRALSDRDATRSGWNGGGVRRL